MQKYPLFMQINVVIFFIGGRGWLYYFFKSGKKIILALQF